jgi:pyruvate,water dikinase
MSDRKLVCNLVEVGIENVGEVGGKNASLGEMIKNLTPKGIRVSGFGR